MSTAAHRTEPTMNRKKPITADEAIAIVERRRRSARDYYARMREDALRYRRARSADAPAPIPGDRDTE